MLTGRYFTTDKIDTRSYDLESGKAIPGTGDKNTCEHCGAEHEVWVYVESESRHIAIVGTSCAKKLRLMSREKFEKSLIKQAKGLCKKINQALYGPNYTPRLEWMAVRAQARVMRRMGHAVELMPEKRTFRVV